MKERIQKLLSEAGYCSRRKAEELLEKGKVTVNGHPAKLGDKAEAGKDIIAVSGERVWMQRNREKHYYILNKPRGYVTTLSDEMGRKCVSDLVADTGLRLYPVGRLDRDSEGMLIMTDDGAFANLVAHPSGGIKKSYRVTVTPMASEEQVTALASGVELDGKRITPFSVRVTGNEPGKTVFEIVIKEGLNREIRRMCEAVGLEVTRLKRTAVGPVKLGSLRAGTYREMTKQEIAAIRNSCSKQ